MTKAIRPARTMTATTNLDAATVEEYCRALRLPTVASQFARLAQDAAANNQTHARFLAALLGAEVEERERGTRRAADS